jgi:hypothetical protein
MKELLCVYNSMSHQHLLLVVIKVLAVIGFISLSSKLSQHNIDHTTLVVHEARSAKERIAPRNVVDTENVSAAVSQMDIPIFLIDPSSHELSAMEWSSIAKRWNRNTTYADILQSNDTIVDATIPFPLNKRVLIFHHLMPKTASSTLRQSCQDTQRDTCGIEPQKKNRRPDGYQTSKRLVQLMTDCPKTRHWCVRADTQPLIGKYMEFHSTNSFLHLFPFRNYDEWAVSALRQIYFREGEEGCLKENELLDECQPHRYELNFERYPKSSIAYFLDSYRRVRRNKVGFTDHHLMLMYDYRYLHEVLVTLNAKYDIPLLAGTDAMMNSERPKGTCEDDVKMLKKFHDCFSDGLESLE